MSRTVAAGCGVAKMAVEFAVICCMAWVLFRWLNNAYSFEIQQRTDKELNQELAGKSQFLVEPKVRQMAAQGSTQPSRTNNNGEPPESEWLAVRAVVVSGQAMLGVLTFCGAAQGIQ